MPALIFLAAFLAVLSTGPNWFFESGDLGWHLAAGRQIAETGEVPREETFSWTVRGRSWIATEWLSELVHWRIFDTAGFLGLLVYGAAVIAATFALIARASLAAGAEPVTSLLLCGWSAYLSSIHWLPRPHLHSWLFLALWYSVLQRHLERRDRLIWLVPLSLPVWLQLHSGWAAGCLMLGLFALGDLLAMLRDRRIVRRRCRDWAALLVLTAALSLVNPYGLELHRELIATLTLTPVLDATQEWKSPDFRGEARPFKGYLVVAVASLAFAPAPVSPVFWVLLLAGLNMSLTSVRHFPVMLIWVTPLMALGVTRGFAEARRLLDLDGCASSMPASAKPMPEPSRGVGWIWPLAAMLLASAGLFPPPIREGEAGFPPQRFPVEAVRYLRDHPPGGRVLNDYGWGGYMAFYLPEGFPVFIDGRNHLYGVKLTSDSLTFQTAAPGWRSLLDEHRIDWVLYPSGSVVVNSLREEGWEVRHSDPVATVLVRPPRSLSEKDAVARSSEGFAGKE